MHQWQRHESLCMEFPGFARLFAAYNSSARVAPDSASSGLIVRPRRSKLGLEGHKRHGMRLHRRGYSGPKPPQSRRSMRKGDIPPWRLSPNWLAQLSALGNEIDLYPLRVLKHISSQFRRDLSNKRQELKSKHLVKLMRKSSRHVIGVLFSS